MQLELVYKIEYVSLIPKEFGMELSLTQLAVKILFSGSTGFDVMRWTIILPEKQKNGYYICLGKGLVRAFTLDRNIFLLCNV